MCLLLCAKMCSNSDSRLGQLLPIYKSSFTGGLDIRPDLVTIIDSCSGSIGGGISGGFEIRPDLVTIIGSSSNGIGGGIGGGVTICCSLGIPEKPPVSYQARKLRVLFADKSLFPNVPHGVFSSCPHALIWVLPLARLAIGCHLVLIVHHDSCSKLQLFEVSVLCSEANP